jgi:hypothetical protein
MLYTFIIYKCMYVCVYVCTYECMCVCMLFMYIYVCICLSFCVGSIHFCNNSKTLSKPMKALIIPSLCLNLKLKGWDVLTFWIWILTTWATCYNLIIAHFHPQNLRRCMCFRLLGIKCITFTNGIIRSSSLLGTNRVTAKCLPTRHTCTSSDIDLIFVHVSFIDCMQSSNVSIFL